MLNAWHVLLSQKSQRVAVAKVYKSLFARGWCEAGVCWEARYA